MSDHGKDKNVWAIWWDKNGAPRERLIPVRIKRAGSVSVGHNRLVASSVLRIKSIAVGATKTRRHSSCKRFADAANPGERLESELRNFNTPRV